MAQSLIAVFGMDGRTWTAVAMLGVAAAVVGGCEGDVLDPPEAGEGGGGASTAHGGTGGTSLGGHGADGGSAGAGNGTTSGCTCLGGYLSLECFCELQGCDGMPTYDEVMAQAASNCQLSVFYDWGAVIQYGGEGSCSTKGVRFMDEAGYDWGYYYDQSTSELCGYHDYNGGSWEICDGEPLSRVGTITECGACLLCGFEDGIEPCDPEPGSG